MQHSNTLSISAPTTIGETIEWLVNTLKRPPLPECPLEAAKRGGTPKQPQYFTGQRLVTINWKEWQDQLPIPEVYNAWFKHPSTGIGTLGGWNGQHWLGWIDFDRKALEPLEFEWMLNDWLEAHPELGAAPQFWTPSGGYRVLVAFRREPSNFKANSAFVLHPNQSKGSGELLSKNGGHTLLPPTIGVNGKPYEWVKWTSYPPVVESPEAIGLYPIAHAITSGTQRDRAGGNTGQEGTDSTPIDKALREAYHLLGIEGIFNWPKHNFKIDANGK